MPLIEVETSPALHLPELDLFLDPHRKKPFGFISLAHADHFARHERILCSPETAHLLRARYRVAADRIQSLPFGETLIHAEHEIRLLPAGHIFGSAMIHLTRISDRSSLLYTGDFKLRPSLTCASAELQPADILIMESTFSLPKFIFPEREKIVADLIAFVKNAFKDNAQPILLAYSLGKAQEALAILSDAGIPTLAYKTVFEMSQACHEAGMPYPPPPLFEGTIPPGHALVAPPNVMRNEPFASMENRCTAMLSGWALTSGAKYRYRTDAVLPLSDHADYLESLETVKTVDPQQVITVHGSTKEFARDLRQRGYQAWSVEGQDQIEFRF